MTEFYLIAASALIFVIIEFVFLAGIYRVNSASSRKRDAEFANLDKERAALVKLQSELLRDAQSAKTIVKEGIAKLNQIGVESHAEWTEMTTKIDEVMAEIETRSAVLVDNTLQTLNKKALESKKLIEISSESNSALLENIKHARKIIRFFDSQVHLDELIKDLQMDKYKEAKSLLQGGHDSQHVAHKLGLSLSEVTLVSHMLS